MTITIPKHLQHLPIHGGLPVPAVVCRHRVGRIELALSSWPDFDLMTVWEGTEGPPDFGKYDEERLRVCIVEKRCHVCWRELPNLLVCVPGEPQFRIVEGKRAMVLVQPWVCAPCLGFAVQHCPPLTAALQAGRGNVMAITEHRTVAVAWRPVNPEDPPIPPRTANGEPCRVLSAFKILPMKAAVQRLPEWAETAGRRFRK